MHFSSGSYERIAPLFFKTLNYDTFYLEYDTPRAGPLSSLRHVPPHKNIILGVVSTKVPTLEDPEDLKRRVREAAQIMAEAQGRSVEDVMRNLGVSPQCGFASVGVGGEGFDEGVMWGKLGLVRDVAMELWPEWN
jgi:methionine synthase II (cobalamin-independent)